MADLIIAGIPRSGTSLAAAIIDGAPDTLCLSEPEGHYYLAGDSGNGAKFVDCLKECFENIRCSVLSGNPILDRRDQYGKPLTNYFSELEPGGRRWIGTNFSLIVRGGLSADFLLGIKHTVLYAAVLPEIVRTSHFRIVGIIRDPVDVILSWRSVRLPISVGRLPIEELFWPELAKLTSSQMDLLEKQIRIHDLICRRFSDWDSNVNVVPYEVFAKKPAQLLHAAGIEMETSPTPISKVTVLQDDVQRSEIANKIVDLVGQGELEGIERYYPQYKRSEEPASLGSSR